MTIFQHINIIAHWYVYSLYFTQ